VQIDAALVRLLIEEQFPVWRDLAVEPVEGGWDNRIFRIGAELLVRMPSAERYAAAVLKEQIWLPKLAKGLPVDIPTVLGSGRPGQGYPWCWSIYRWIDGEPASAARVADEASFARELARFLVALHRIPADGGPGPGVLNFHRGGSLMVYDAQVREAICRLASQAERRRVQQLWDIACSSRWGRRPVWVHGDFAPGNLLVSDGRLRAVIDFGQLGTGDPACDLAIAWTRLTARSRRAFRDALGLDDETWARARGWAAWKAAILATGVAKGPSAATNAARVVLSTVLDEAAF